MAKVDRRAQNPKEFSSNPLPPSEPHLPRQTMYRQPWMSPANFSLKVDFALLNLVSILWLICVCVWYLFGRGIMFYLYETLQEKNDPHKYWIESLKPRYFHTLEIIKLVFRHSVLERYSLGSTMWFQPFMYWGLGSWGMGGGVLRTRSCILASWGFLMPP